MGAFNLRLSTSPIISDEIARLPQITNKKSSIYIPNRSVRTLKSGTQVAQFFRIRLYLLISITAETKSGIASVLRMTLSRADDQTP